MATTKQRFHRNLHNAKAGGPQWVRTAGGRVAEYLDSVVLTDVTTRIQPAGQRKCAEKQVRSVCAYLDGVVADEAPQGEWQRVAYDPRRDTGFSALRQTWDDTHRVTWEAADAVLLNSDGSAYVLNPRRALSNAMVAWVKAAEADGRQDPTLNFEWEFGLSGPKQAERLYDQALEVIS